MAALKLVSFMKKESTGWLLRTGILLPTGDVVDIMKNCSNELRKHSGDMVKLITYGEELSIESELRELASNYSRECVVPMDVFRGKSDYRLVAPIQTPHRNLFCVGKNYLDHVLEVSKAGGNIEPPPQPKYPQLFSKVPLTVIGNGDNIPSHSNTTRWLDYEAELAVVIGKKGRDISREDANSYIFGYTIANDVSARDVQKRHVQFMKGKCLDGTCPMGPYILHKSDIGDASNLSIKLWVNDDLRQNSNTGNMIFDVPEIIRQLSQGMTLLPGDIILTGTPAGVGFAMDPPQMLKNGDRVAIEIEKLGRLENVVRDM